MKDVLQCSSRCVLLIFALKRTCFCHFYIYIGNVFCAIQTISFIVKKVCLTKILFLFDFQLCKEYVKFHAKSIWMINDYKSFISSSKYSMLSRNKNQNIFYKIRNIYFISTSYHKYEYLLKRLYSCFNLTIWFIHFMAIFISY